MLDFWVEFGGCEFFLGIYLILDLVFQLYIEDLYLKRDILFLKKVNL